MNPTSMLPQSDKPKTGGKIRRDDNKKGSAAILSTDVVQNKKPTTDHSDKMPVLGAQTTRWSVEERKAFWKEKSKKVYPFKHEKVSKIFRDALANDTIELPSTRHQDPDNKVGRSSFCPYHRRPGHVIEDCYVFKDWLEKMYKEGKVSLSQLALQDPASQQVSFVAVDFDLKSTQVKGPTAGDDDGEINSS